MTENLTYTYDDLDEVGLQRVKLLREIELLDQDVTKRSIEAANLERNFHIATSQHQESGEFLFYDGVTDETVWQAIQQMDNWSRRFPEGPMVLTFHSPGGYVSDGLHFYDFLQDLRERGHHLTTKAYGTAASMGAVLLQAGDVRVMSPNCFLMVHEVSAGTRGKVSNQEEQLAFTKRLQAKCLAILAERSTLTVKQVENRWKKTDWWLDAAEAVALGLVDEVGL